MSNAPDGKAHQSATNREKASGQRDEFSQRAHETHLKVEEELKKNHSTDDSKQTQAASKGVMKREKEQNANPHQDEGETKAKVDDEGNNNTTEASDQSGKDEEADRPLQAEKQREIALRKAAAVFEDVQRKTHKADPQRRPSASNDNSGGEEKQGKAEKENKEEESKSSDDQADSVKVKATEAKEKVKEGASDAKAKVQEGAAQVKAKVQEKAADVKEKVQDGASHAKAKVEEGAAHVKAKVAETADKAGNVAGHLKEDASHKMEEMRDSAVAWKDSAVQQGVEVKETIVADLKSAKEMLVNSPAEIRHKSEELQAAASDRSQRVQQAVSEGSEAARQQLDAASQKVKEEASHLQSSAASTLHSAQQHIASEASFIAAQTKEARVGLLSFVTDKAEAVKETVEGWGEAAKERMDQAKEYMEGEHREEVRKDEDDNSHHSTLTEKASELWHRNVSSSDSPTFSPTVDVETSSPRHSLPSPSSLDSSTSDVSSDSDVVDLSHSAVPEFSGRVPSLGNYDGIRGEDAGMGDGARLAAMVQDMSEL